MSSDVGSNVNADPSLRRVSALARHLAPRVLSVSQVLPSFLEHLRREAGSAALPRQSPPEFTPSRIAYISPHESLSSETLQAGVVLVAHPRPDVRKAFIDRLCQAAVERSLLVYAISPEGSNTVSVPGVFRLMTHATLSRRAILSALLRHGAHVLVFGLVSTRDDVSLLMEAAYTGYHTVAEVFGESPQDVLARLETIGVDATMLPKSLRVIVPVHGDQDMKE
ncbi:Type II secretion system (T2SS)-related protein GspEL1 [Andalucia godoyi]|uniref:Type II secretion system (T2SS)-related protein GspEL1 n=1 Tax=Andalucia godoyi TaxID=505711 RepID=A0A8K0AI30_ANDGO|nr:Type II secretion system (T2SS)-related protein GspEL1 [Andalucia godoyi]|eukprot:ANDGO_07158.mRNA.1 Type II secretion system (T2SS)-related protein GspEL1